MVSWDELTKKAFINLCHPFQPFIIQKICGPKYLLLYIIFLLLCMENTHREIWRDRMDEAFDPRMKEHYFVNDTNIDNLGLSGKKKFLEMGSIYLSYLILIIEPKIIKEANLEVYHLSYYIKWDPQSFYYKIY